MIACSVVAVIAIVVFLIALLGSGGNHNDELISVPTLVGKNYDMLQVSEDFIINPPNYEHNDEYEKGQIFHQTPEPGMQVGEGTVIRIWVSLGPEPQVKTMEDLVDLEEERAKSFLDDQDMDLQVLVRTESSDTIDAGRVTRTDPEQGTPLTKGQTVYLWVSTGPDVETAKMPNVLGRDVEMAISLLKAAGFNDIETEEVESDKAKGVVISQSEEKNTDVDITTTIYLEYSACK